MVYLENRGEKIGVDEYSIPQLVVAMRYKAENIKAKADPVLFMRVAEELETYQNLIHEMKRLIERMEK